MTVLDLVTAAIPQLKGKKIITKSGIIGNILDISIEDNDQAALLLIKFSDEPEAAYGIDPKFYDLTKSDPEVAEFFTDYLKLVGINRAEKKAADEAARLARIEAEKQTAEASNLAKRIATNKTKAKDFVDGNYEKPDTDDIKANGFWYAIGWLAKHITHMKAAMPTSMEPFIRSKFDIPANSISSIPDEYRSPAGWPGQWDLSLSITVDSSDLPPYMEGMNKVAANPRIINNTEFVWYIADKCGFQFKKGRQNIDRILEEVPEKYLDDFNDGYYYEKLEGEGYFTPEDF